MFEFAVVEFAKSTSVWFRTAVTISSLRWLLKQHNTSCCNAMFLASRRFQPLNLSWPMFSGPYYSLLHVESYAPHRWNCWSAALKRHYASVGHEILSNLRQLVFGSRIIPSSWCAKQIQLCCGTLIWGREWTVGRSAHVGAGAGAGRLLDFKMLYGAWHRSSTLDWL